MRKSEWKEYLTFSKKERNAIIILIAVPVFVIVLPFFIQSKHEIPVIDKDAMQQWLSLQQYADTAKPYYQHQSYDYTTATDNTQTVSASLFYFDPNTLNADGWKRLGIRDRTIQTILNYRNKGGHFYKADDIKKIYGLHEDEANRLIPYIRLTPSTEKNDYNNYSTYKNDTQSFTKKSTYKSIDVNTATAEEWKAFPGIGDVLSNRIVKFRNSMGGFTSIDQVRKTYGLPDSTFRAILPYLGIGDSSNSKK